MLSRSRAGLILSFLIFWSSTLFASPFKSTAPSYWKNTSAEPDLAVYQNTRSLRNHETITTFSFSRTNTDGGFVAALDDGHDDKQKAVISKLRAAVFSRMGLGNFTVLEIKKVNLPHSKFKFMQVLQSRYVDLKGGDVQTLERQYFSRDRMYVVTYLIDAPALNDRENAEHKLDFFRPTEIWRKSAPPRAADNREERERTPASSETVGGAGAAPSDVDIVKPKEIPKSLDMQSPEAKNLCAGVPADELRQPHEGDFLNSVKETGLGAFGCLKGLLWDNAYGMVSGLWSAVKFMNPFSSAYSDEVLAGVGTIGAEVRKDPVEFSKNLARGIYNMIVEIEGKPFSCFNNKEQWRKMCNVASFIVPAGLSGKILANVPLAAEQVAKVAQILKQGQAELDTTLKIGQDALKEKFAQLQSSSKDPAAMPAASSVPAAAVVAAPARSSVPSIPLRGDIASRFERPSQPLDDLLTWSATVPLLNDREIRLLSQPRKDLLGEYLRVGGERAFRDLERVMRAQKSDELVRAWDAVKNQDPAMQLAWLKIEVRLIARPSTDARNALSGAGAVSNAEPRYGGRWYSPPPKMPVSKVDAAAGSTKSSGEMGGAPSGVAQAADESARHLEMVVSTVAPAVRKQKLYSLYSRMTELHEAKAALPLWESSAHIDAELARVQHDAGEAMISYAGTKAADDNNVWIVTSDLNEASLPLLTEPVKTKPMSEQGKTAREGEYAGLLLDERGIPKKDAQGHLMIADLDVEANYSLEAPGPTEYSKKRGYENPLDRKIRNSINDAFSEIDNQQDIDRVIVQHGPARSHPDEKVQNNGGVRNRRIFGPGGVIIVTHTDEEFAAFVSAIKRRGFSAASAP